MLTGEGEKNTNLGRVETVTDERGNITKYFYYGNGLLKGTCLNDGDGIIYTYNNYGQLILAREAQYSNGDLVAETGTEINYTYTSKLDLSKIQTNTETYSFTYDEFGKTTGIVVGDYNLVAYTYASDNGNLTRMDYGNGTYITYTYDNLDRVTATCYNGIQKAVYTYAPNGDVSTVTDVTNDVTYSYYYDEAGICVMERAIKDNLTLYAIGYVYDEHQRLSAVNTYYPSEQGANKQTTSYTYDEDGNVSQVYHTNNIAETYTYDDFGRIASSSVNLTNGTNVTGIVINNSYTYVPYGTTGTTNLVGNVATTIGPTTYTTSYTYDENGNITACVRSDSGYVYYTYDDKNQLIEEDNSALNETYEYTYDNNGNILTKETYNYSTGTLGTLKSIKTYTYGDSTWGDLLTSYNGTAITYDEIGNPLIYNNGNRIFELEWQNGRELDKLYINGTNTLLADYGYNQDGIRVSRTLGNTRYDYTLQGTKIVRQTETSITTGNLTKDSYYYYDANGVISSAKIYQYTTATPTEYNLVFRTNMQGDVIAIYNSSGTMVVGFTYDAWGNFTNTTSSGSMPTAEQMIALNTPFRYRGYVYDYETGFYYLNSRYYDPASGRFINADSYVSTGADFVGCNMFAYCGNNPVNMADSAGNWPKWIDTLRSVIFSPIVNHVISAIQSAIADTKVSDSYTTEEAIEAIEEITGDGTVKFENNNVEIKNSYEIESQDRLIVSKIIQNTVDENGEKYTNRTAYSLSAEWAGHNILYNSNIYRNTGTQNVNLDYKLINNKFYTIVGTVILIAIGAV